MPQYSDGKSPAVTTRVGPFYKQRRQSAGRTFGMQSPPCIDARCQWRRMDGRARRTALAAQITPTGMVVLTTVEL